MSEQRTRVIHVRDMVHYPDAVYVGRAMPRQGLKGSKWGNPWKVGMPMPSLLAGTRPLPRDEAIRRYKDDLMNWPDRRLLAALPELRGKPIACWCRHDGEERTEENACHGDVLVEMLDKYTNEELREMGGES